MYKVFRSLQLQADLKIETWEPKSPELGAGSWGFSGIHFSSALWLQFRSRVRLVSSGSTPSFWEPGARERLPNGRFPRLALKGYMSIPLSAYFREYLEKKCLFRKINIGIEFTDKNWFRNAIWVSILISCSIVRSRYRMPELAHFPKPSHFPVSFKTYLLSS